MGQGQGQEVTTDNDSKGSKVKKGLKSLGTCEVPQSTVAANDGQAEHKGLFHQAMSGATSFAKKTKNDVVCGARDVPHAAAAIKQDGVNRQTVGRMAGDVLKTTEVMPHQMMWNAAGGVVKHETGYDLTPGGLKTKVAAAAIGVVLDHSLNARQTNTPGFEGGVNPNAVQATALSAINLMRGRAGALQTMTTIVAPEVVNGSPLRSPVGVSAGFGLWQLR